MESKAPEKASSVMEVDTPMPSAQSTQTLAQWEAETLEHVLLATLDASKAAQFVYLNTLAAELREEKGNLQL